MVVEYTHIHIVGILTSYASENSMYSIANR